MTKEIKQKLTIECYLQRWLDTPAGQTFMNYAYSWGASIVILGTLFKLTHLSYANLMLFVGMGTEVVVFFLSAFDRPYKMTEGIQPVTVTTGTKEAAGNKDSEPYIIIGKDDEWQPQPTAAPAPAGIPLTPDLRGLEMLTSIQPDKEQFMAMKDTFDAIHEEYKRQLVIVHGQLKNVEKIDEEVKLMATYLGELNKIYKRTIEAMKAP